MKMLHNVYDHIPHVLNRGLEKENSDNPSSHVLNYRIEADGSE